MRRILISGGAGFIGTSLVRLLAEAGGYEVTVLDNLSPQIHGPEARFPEDLAALAHCVRGDVTVPGDWAAALEGQEAVVHLAAETGTGQSMYELSRYAAVNVVGTAHLLDACRERFRGVKRIVLASSRAVYGEGRYECHRCGPFYPGPRSAADMERGEFEVRCPVCLEDSESTPTPESSPLVPVSVYGATKVSQEHLIGIGGRTSGIQTVALRFQNVFGPGQSLRNPYTGMLSVFSGLILGGREINVFEDGKESRDMVFVSDVAEALRLALEAETPVCSTYNIGTGRAISVRQIVDLLAEGLGRTAVVNVSGNFREGDVRHCRATVAAARDGLGFAPRVSLENGLAHFCEWVLQQDVPPSAFERSLLELAKRQLLRERNPR